jgi:hypothetical protein
VDGLETNTGSGRGEEENPSYEAEERRVLEDKGGLDEA